MIVCFYCGVNSLFAQIPLDTLLINNDGDYSLNEHLYYLKELNNDSYPEKIANKPLKEFIKLYPKKVLDIGVADGYYWLVFTLKNNTEEDGSYFFKLNYPVANVVACYSKITDNYKLIGKSGIAIPFYKRPYINADIVFELKLRAKQTTTYLIMVDKLGEGINIMPTLKNAKTQHADEQFTYTLYGLIVGIMLANIIINLFLFISLKQKIHILYACYATIMMFWVLNVGSLDYQFIFFNYPHLPIIMEFILTGIGIILMSYLLVTFLDLNSKNSSYLLPIKIIRIGFMILVPLSYFVFLVYHQIVWLRVGYLYIFLGFCFVGVITVVGSAFQRSIQNYKPAWFFLASCIYLAFAVIQYVLYLLGIHVSDDIGKQPTNIQIGILVETSIIFLGIIYRYNLYKKEKQALELEIIKQKEEKAQHILLAQEEERKRLAQDLHDDVGATLSTLVLHVSNLSENQNLNHGEFVKHNQMSLAISKKALSDLRLVSHNLLPNDFSTLGIFSVLQNRITELNNITQIDFHFNYAGEDKTLPNLFSITVYRIINELLSNVIKHSLASTCSVDLVIDKDNLTLIMEDNGTGIELNGNNFGIGLKNIKSRVDYLNGVLNIDSNKKGTSIIVEIAIDKLSNE